jgi:biopolymer transport protein TolR
MTPSSMNSRRGRRLMGEINVVPYIDVMLVLLIIFMVTAPMLTQGIKVDLPKAGAEPLPEDLVAKNQPLVLSVDRKGLFYISIGKDSDKPVNDNVIKERVSTVLRRAPKTPVLVKADRNVPYGRVVTGMVLLQEAGAEQIGFMTDPRDSLPQPKN